MDCFAFARNDDRRSGLARLSLLNKRSAFTRLSHLNKRSGLVRLSHLNTRSGLARLSNLKTPPTPPKSENELNNLKKCELYQYVTK
ncbi:MAG: hypothetical protein ACLFR0_04895 [Alphaproteobacteria bacterium]